VRDVGGIPGADAGPALAEGTSELVPSEPASTPIGVAVAAWAFLAPLAFSPALFSPVWAPKFAALLVLAGLGLPLVLRRGDRPSYAALGFLLVCGVSTALSANPAMSLVGPWNWGTGLVLVLGMVGGWAAGRQLTSNDLPLLWTALLSSILIVAAVSVAQMGVSLAAFELPLVFGRSTGMQGNPVYLGSLLVVGVALLAGRARAGAIARWGPAAALIGAALGTAQGRVALVAAAGICLVSIRTVGLRRAGLLGAALALGWSVGTALALNSSLPNAPGNRIDSGVGTAAVQTYTVREGFGPRFEVWSYSRHAVSERPVLGAGPGRFWSATLPHRSLESTRFGPTSYYSDPHNFVVEYAVTTGVLGIAFLAAWLWLAGRRATGPFGWAAGALLFIHLFQPQNALVTPLALLCLGAAAPRWESPRSFRWPALGAAIAAVVAVVFLFGQLQLRKAYLTFDQAAAHQAHRILFAWPEVADRSGVVAASALDRGDTPDWGEVRRYYREATDRDPQDPRPWLRLGDFELGRGEPLRAEQAYRRAVAIEPWSHRAAARLAEIERRRGNAERANYWRKRAEAVTGRK
jgi:O-antigen ligase